MTKWYKWLLRARVAPGRPIMAGETIVFFPKYSALTGSAAGVTYYSDPYELTGYKTLTAEVYYAAGTPTISCQLQQSSDLITWSNLGTAMTPAALALTSQSNQDSARYVRMAITVTSAGNLAATLWSKAVSRDA